jgi:hypothetical protein
MDISDTETGGMKMRMNWTDGEYGRLMKK